MCNIIRPCVSLISLIYYLEIDVHSSLITSSRLDKVRADTGLGPILVVVVASLAILYRSVPVPVPIRWYGLVLYIINETGTATGTAYCRY